MIPALLPTPKPIMASTDKKMRATIKKNKIINDETKLRLQEQRDYFNTEEAGFIEVDSDNERERTLKVK
jgi:hypothetical protein